MLNVPLITLFSLFMENSQTNIVLLLYQNISDKETAVNLGISKETKWVCFTFMCTS
jgi:hypothetical protein